MRWKQREKKRQQKVRDCGRRLERGASNDRGNSRDVGEKEKEERQKLLEAAAASGKQLAGKRAFAMKVVCSGFAFGAPFV